MRPVIKSARHETAHELRRLFNERITDHVPGVEVAVIWSSGYARQTREALDRAVTEVRAQIVDAEEDQ